MPWNAKLKTCWAMLVVIGVGNVLLSDEGLGVHVVKLLSRHFHLPPEVSLVDGGTLGWELVPELEKARSLIIVDAISGGKAPGTVYQLEGDAVLRYFRQKISAHEAGIQEVLAYLQMKGKRFEQLVVLGVEPQTLETGIALSAPVAGALLEIFRRLSKLLQAEGYSMAGTPPTAEALHQYLETMVP